MAVHEVITREDGTEELRPLRRVDSAPRPGNAMTEKQARGLRNLILLKLLTTEEKDE